MDVLGVPQTHLGRPHSRADRTATAVGLNLARALGIGDGRTLRRYLVASVACGLVIAAATIAAATVLARLVAGVITQSGGPWGDMLFAVAVLWVVQAAATWAQGRLSQRGASAVIGELAGDVLRSVTARPPRQLAADRDAAAAVVTRGLDGLRPYFTGYLPALVLAVLLTPAALIVMACFDLQAAAIVTIALPLVPIFMVLIGLVTSERSEAALAAMTTLQARLLDLVAGLPTLRALGRAEGSAARIAELSAAHRRSTMATLRIAFLSAMVLELLATLGVALVAVSVGLRLVFGEITLSAALTVLLLAPEVFWPLRRVGAAFHAAQDGKTAAAAALQLIDAEAGAAGARRISTANPVIDIEGLDTEFEPGRVTVLTGPNGVGKSTALHAILGLTSTPKVHVDGIDVSTLELSGWWQYIAWLPHRPVLVPGTVRANLELLGPLPDLEKACRQVGFDTVLRTLPEGLDTTIGRDGTGLSLGQRQRLGLARVLGSPAQVLLLDEPTAHLDAETEALVLDTIVARARAGATVVVVGHRDTVLAIGDHVVTMGDESRVHR